MTPEPDHTWHNSFVHFVEEQGQLPVSDPVQHCDTYVYAQEGELFIHVDGQGDFHIDPGDAAKDYSDWVGQHVPPSIPD